MTKRPAPPRDAKGRFPKGNAGHGAPAGAGWGGPAKGASEAAPSRRIEDGGVPAKQALGPEVMQFRADYRERTETELLQVWDSVFSDTTQPAPSRVVAVEKYYDRVYGPVVRTNLNVNATPEQAEAAKRASEAARLLIAGLSELARPEPLTIEGEVEDFDGSGGSR